MTQAKIDELTILARRIYEAIQDMSDEEKKKYSIDAVMESSIQGYIDGARRDEWNDVELDLDDMEEALYFVFDEETFEDRIVNHIDGGTWDEATIERLLETEYHRCEETGAYDSAKQYANKHNTRMVKVYQTMMDMKVRDTHDYLQGMEVGIDDDFYTYDGDHAPFPGQFTLAENNINCRCWVEYKTRESL